MSSIRTHTSQCFERNATTFRTGLHKIQMGEKVIRAGCTFRILHA